MDLPIVKRQMRPVLQLALDNFDMPSALASVQSAADYVDIIEVGTVLCFSEGMRAVREIRALFPDKPVLADVRVVEAGRIISRLAFEAGASLVSVVSGASDTTVGQVCEVAREFGGQVQVEIGQYYSYERAVLWRELGVEHVIVKRSRDEEGAAERSNKWGEDDFNLIRDLHAAGFMVTVTGGIRVEQLVGFSGLPVAVFIAGRAVVDAVSPRQAAAELKSEIGRVWP